MALKPVPTPSPYLQARLAARKRVGALEAAAAGRFAKDVNRYGAALEAHVRKLKVGNVDAVVAAIKRETSEFANAVALATQEARDVAFEDTLDVWERAAVETARHSKIGLVRPAPLTFVGGFASLGGLPWQTALAGSAFGGADELESIVRLAMLEGVNRDELARRIRGYVTGSEALKDHFEVADTMTGEVMKFDLRKVPASIRTQARRMVQNARRIAVSEIHNARAEAETVTFLRDPLVAAVRWELSPNRSSSSFSPPDVCDTMAASDFYGLGPGKYPCDAVPPPPHPYDRCERVPVMRSFKDATKPKPSPQRSPNVLGSIPGMSKLSPKRIEMIRQHASRMVDYAEETRPQFREALKAAMSPKAPAKVLPVGVVSLMDGAKDVILGKKIGGQGGSNPGGVYLGTDGVTRYVKFYTDDAQAAGEALANDLYRRLGVQAPVSEVFVMEGKLAHAARMVESEGTIGSLGLTAQDAEKILDGFVADVLTANWDAVGTGLDNVVRLADGSIAKIDQGGTFLLRAMGSRKPVGVLGKIDEWVKFPDPATNAYYAQVFKKAGVANGDAMGDRAVAQIDAVLALRQEVGGWAKYVSDALPGFTGPDRKAIVDLLESRTKLLAVKRGELLAAKEAKALAAKADEIVAKVQAGTLSPSLAHVDLANALAPDPFKPPSPAVKAVLDGAKKKVDALAVKKITTEIDAIAKSIGNGSSPADAVAAVSKYVGDPNPLIATHAASAIAAAEYESLAWAGKVLDNVLDGKLTPAQGVAKLMEGSAKGIVLPKNLPNVIAEAEALGKQAAKKLVKDIVADAEVTGGFNAAAKSLGDALAAGKVTKDQFVAGVEALKAAEAPVAKAIAAEVVGKHVDLVGLTYLDADAVLQKVLEASAALSGPDLGIYNAVLPILKHIQGEAWKDAAFALKHAQAVLPPKLLASVGNAFADEFAGAMTGFAKSVEGLGYGAAKKALRDFAEGVLDHVPPGVEAKGMKALYALEDELKAKLKTPSGVAVVDALPAKAGAVDDLEALKTAAYTMDGAVYVDDEAQKWIEYLDYATKQIGDDVYALNKTLDKIDWTVSSGTLKAYLKTLVQDHASKAGGTPIVVDDLVALKGALKKTQAWSGGDALIEAHEDNWLSKLLGGESVADVLAKIDKNYTSNEAKAYFTAIVKAQGKTATVMSSAPANVASAGVKWTSIGIEHATAGTEKAAEAFKLAEILDDVVPKLANAGVVDLVDGPTLAALTKEIDTLADAYLGGKLTHATVQKKIGALRKKIAKAVEAHLKTGVETGTITASEAKSALKLVEGKAGVISKAGGKKLAKELGEIVVDPNAALTKLATPGAGAVPIPTVAKSPWKAGPKKLSEILEDASKGKLSASAAETVIVELGTTGTISKAAVADAVKALGKTAAHVEAESIVAKFDALEVIVGADTKTAYAEGRKTINALRDAGKLTTAEADEFKARLKALGDLKAQEYAKIAAADAADKAAKAKAAQAAQDAADSAEFGALFDPNAPFHEGQAVVGQFGAKHIRPREVVGLAPSKKAGAGDAVRAWIEQEVPSASRKSFYDAISTWTGGSYQEINSWVRGFSAALDKLYKRRLPDLMEFLTKAPKYHGLTRRGVGYADKARFDTIIATLEQAHTSGAKWADLGFFATSKNTSWDWGSSTYHLMFKVTGKSGVDVSRVGGLGSEAEVLYPPRVPFRVKSIKRSKVGYGERVEIELEEV